MLTSLCAVAIACPTGAWGAADTAIGAGGENFSPASLGHNLNIINGSTKAGEEWALIYGQPGVSESKEVNSYTIYGVQSLLDSGDASATMKNDDSQFSLTISDTGDPTTFSQEVYGGYAKSSSGNATASKNILDIKSGTFNSYVYGGYADSSSGNATASENILTIYGGTFDDDNSVIAGTAATTSVDSASAAFGNQLIIQGGVFGGWGLGGYATSSHGDATASENILTISGNVTFNNSVYAGYAMGETSAEASNNTLKISETDNTTFSNSVYGGYAEAVTYVLQLAVSNTTYKKATANSNTVTISGGTFGTDTTAANVYGGYAQSYSGDATASENILTISGGTFGTNTTPIDIYGGYALVYSNTATANGNKVIIERGSDGNNPTLTNATLYGGYGYQYGGSTVSTGSDNTLKIYTTGLEAKNVKYFQKYEFILPNTVQSGDTVLTLTEAGTDISDTTVSVAVKPGTGLQQEDSVILIANENGITMDNITQGTISADEGIAAEYIFTLDTTNSKQLVAKVSQIAISEAVGATGTNLTKALTVSADGKTDANWSSQNISIKDTYVFGVKDNKTSGDALASMSGDGSLTILGTGSDSDSPKYVYGAYAVTTSGKAEAKDAKLTISNGTFDMNVYGGYANGTTEASATGNSVTISGGKFGEDGNPVFIHAGYAETVEGTATASGNTVNVSGGTFSGTIYGSYAGSYSGTATANDNTVTITGNGEFYNVFGAYALSTSNSATASNNTMTISGGTFKGDVIGAYIMNSSGVSTASNNTLTISGGTFNNYIYNLLVITGSGTVNSSDNTMIIEGKPTLTNATLCGGCLLGSSEGPIDGNTLKIYTTDLTAQNVKYFQNYVFVLPNTVKNNDVVLTLSGGDNKDKTDISNSTVSVGVKSGSALAQGNQVILLKNANGLISTGFKQDNEKIKAEQGIALTYEFDVSATDTELVATVTSAGAGEEAKAPVEAQTVAPAMLNQAADLIATEGMQSLTAMPAGGIMGTFGVASAGNLRHKTGSHTNVKGVSTLIGVGKRFDPSYGVLYTGAFFEYGYGDYSAHNDFSTGYVRGDGHSRYYGGGVMARYDIPCGFYGELSLRFGGSDTYWSSKDLGANYDSNGMYFGTHVALGYLWKFAKDFKLDVYGKYFYAYQEGDKVSILGDTFDFDSVNSNRLRLGARLGYDFCEMLAGYVGAAWEREFSGSANATVYGYDVVAPSLRGNSGIFEGGLSFKPKKDLSFSTDIGITGYVGQKKGVTGYLKLNYSF